MTKLLEQAITEMTKLPADQQDAIATIVLEELADEAWWHRAFAGSQEQLAKLAKRTREEIRAGRVRKMGFDEL